MNQLCLSWDRAKESYHQVLDVHLLLKINEDCNSLQKYFLLFSVSSSEDLIFFKNSLWDSNGFLCVKNLFQIFASRYRFNILYLLVKTFSHLSCLWKLSSILVDGFLNNITKYLWCLFVFKFTWQTFKALSDRSSGIEELYITCVTCFCW